MLSSLRIGYRGTGFNYKCLCPLSSNAIWLDTVWALCGAHCAVNNSSTTETQRATKETQASLEPRILACRFNTKEPFVGEQHRLQIKCESLFLTLSWNQVTTQSQLTVCPTLPDFPFLCRTTRLCAGPEGNSGLEDGHRRAVRRSDGINSLDHDLHVLSHRTSLAQGLNSFQERSVSCQSSWELRTV